MFDLMKNKEIKANNCFENVSSFLIVQVLKVDYFHRTVVLADIQRKKEKLLGCHFSGE